MMLYIYKLKNFTISMPAEWESSIIFYLEKLLHNAWVMTLSRMLRDFTIMKPSGHKFKVQNFALKYIYWL